MTSQPPMITGVSCNAGGARPTFQVTWNTSGYQPGQQFVIGLFDINQLNPISTSQPTTGGLGTIAASVDLDSSKTYQIQVATWNGNNAGPWPGSGPLALFVAPTGFNIGYDGTAITASWTNPRAGAMPLGGRVYIALGSLQYAFDLPSSGGTFVPQDVPLDPAQTTTLFVRPVYGLSIGPPSTVVTLIQTTYALALIDNPGANPRTIQVAGFQAGTPRTFDVLLNTNGSVIQTWSSLREEGLHGLITLELNSEPVAGVAYQIAVRQRTTGSIGPIGEGAALVIVPAAVSQITYAPGATDTIGFTTPAPLGDPISGLQLTLRQLGSPTTTIAQLVVAGTTGSFQVPHLATDQNYDIVVRPALGLQGGVSLGPANPFNPPVLTAAPAISTAVYDGSLLKATWLPSGQTGVSGYQLEVVVGTMSVATARFPSTQGAISFAADPSLGYQIQVRAIGTASIGAATTSPVSLILPAPVVTTATTDPLTGTTNVTWSAVTGATSYNLQLYADGLPVGQPVVVPGTSSLLAQPLIPQAKLTATVAAVAGSSGLTVTGPAGLPFVLPTGQPVMQALDYNGTTVEMTWTRVPDATGYIISVYATGATQPVYQTQASAAATSSVFSPAIADQTKTYQVVVQAARNGNSGPPSAPVALFTPAIFVSADLASIKAPYLFPATSLQRTASDSTLYLPDLGAGTALRQPLPNVGAFQLAQNSASATNSVFPYLLSIAATSEAWTFGAAPIRTQLQSDYVAFLQQAETAGVVPAGMALLQQVIARAMPQTFQETLYYAYGIDPVQGCADLRPGMILRVVFNDYLNVGVTPTPVWLNGYTGGSTLDYDIGSYLSAQGTWTVGFDAFIAQLVTNGVMQVSPPQASVPGRTEAGIADAADLFYPAFRAPFYRLFFPTDLQSPTTPGSVFNADNFVLAAAASYALLNSTVRDPTTSNAVAYFRGRAVVKLCIRVVVNGVEQVVPIGTTVSNILERAGRLPPSTAVGLTGLRLERARGPVVQDATAACAIDGTYRVRLDWQHLAVYGPGWDALSLPLLHGDHLTIGS